MTSLYDISKRINLRSILHIDHYACISSFGLRSSNHRRIGAATNLITKIIIMVSVTPMASKKLLSCWSFTW